MHIFTYLIGVDLLLGGLVVSCFPSSPLSLLLTGVRIRALAPDRPVEALDEGGMSVPPVYSRVMVIMKRNEAWFDII